MKRKVIAAFFCIAAVLSQSIYAQGVEAKDAFARLKRLSASGEFLSAYAAESKKLISVEDELWLAGALAAETALDAYAYKLLGDKASLLELLGRYDEAADIWEAAAKKKPAGAPFISAAACRLAVGKASEAAALLKAAASFALPPAESKLLRLLQGWTELAQGNAEAARLAADALCADAALGIAVPACMLAIAATEGDIRAAYEKKLAALPNRPEAASIPFMFLYTASKDKAPRRTEPVVQAPPASESQQSAAKLVYQVGVFRSEDNAKALLAKLVSLRFDAVYKYDAKRSLHAVYVKPGSDSAATVLALKNAGYEAWAVDALPD